MTLAFPLPSGFAHWSRIITVGGWKSANSASFLSRSALLLFSHSFSCTQAMCMRMYETKLHYPRKNIFLWSTFFRKASLSQWRGLLAECEREAFIV
jgi:hypothetical protein